MYMITICSNWRDTEDSDEGGDTTVSKFTVDYWEDYINVASYKHNQ
jgi:hypothetical protein